MIGAVILAALTLAGVVVWSQRARIAEDLIAGAARGAGFETAAVKVSEFSLSNLVLSRFSAGSLAAPTTIDLNNVEVEFDLREAVLERRVRRVSIATGVLSAAIGPDGAISLAGYSPSPREPSPVPFDRIEVAELMVSLLTEAGPVATAIGGSLDLKEGGSLAIRAEAEQAGAGDVVIRELAGAVELAFAPDGAIKITGDVAGDARSAAGSISALRVQLSGRMTSWKEVLAGGAEGLRGESAISFSSGAIASSNAGEPAAVGEASGALRLEIGEGLTVVTLADGGLKFSGGDLSGGDRARVSVRSRGTAPLLRSSADSRAVQAIVEFAEGALVSSVEFEAASAQSGPWTFSASGRSAIAIGVRPEPNALSYLAEGVLDGSRANGRLKAEGDLAAYSAGDWSVVDGSASIDADWSADLDRSVFVVGADPGSCIEISSLSVRSRAAASGLSTPRLRVCPLAGEALARFAAGSTPQADIALRIDAETMTALSGETRLAIDRPTAHISGAVAPGLTIAGALSSGSITVNNAYEFATLETVFEWREDQGSFLINELAFRDMRSAPAIGRMNLNGEARLASGRANFNAKALTPGGDRLAAIEGRHDVATGAGQVDLRLEDISFAGGKIQPANILPALTGLVSNVTGGVSGEAKLEWGAGGLSSAGSVELDGLSFRGPGVAVSRTEGLNGSIRFESLAPLKTAGEQRIEIGLVDLDALRLEGGNLRFSLDGDDRLHVISGEFPWFGGTIGVYEAFAPLDGSTVELRLRAENVDLAETLAFLKVDGLSGEGRVRGELPIVVAAGKAQIRDGVLSAVGPGVIRYVGGASSAGQTNEQAQLAFDILRDLRFSELSATINGPLDGDLAFDLLFEGTSEVSVGTGRRSGRVTSPVIYRLNIEAPLLALIEQARVSSDFQLQLERAGIDVAPKTGSDD